MADEPAKPADSKPSASADVPVTQALKQVRPAVPERIVIHPWPKIVLAWPLALTSIVFYFLGGGWWKDPGPLIDPSALGWWWMFVFFFNLLVQTFDFGRGNVIATFATTAVILLGLYVYELQSQTAVYGAIYKFFREANLALHPNFYLCIFAIFAVLFIFAFLATRFDYWVLEPNRLMHKHGLLGDERQYATLQMSVEKEIPDLLEWVIFGGGRLIFKPGPGADAHKTLIVDNVFRVNSVERRVREYLGSIKVDEDRSK